MGGSSASYPLPTLRARARPPGCQMSAISAEFFGEGVSRVGAVVAGRRTYDLNGGWGGGGPIPRIPPFVVTHRAPDPLPASDPPHTFVTEGIDHPVEDAQDAASGKNVHVMGQRSFSSASGLALLRRDERAWPSAGCARPTDELRARRSDWADARTRFRSRRHRTCVSRSCASS